MLMAQLYGAGYLSAKSYKWLMEVQGLMEKKEYNLALDSLSKLETVTKERAYDLAFIHQTFGYIYLEMDKPVFATHRFEQALALELLPKPQTLNILQNLGALYMQEEAYGKAVAVLQQWLDLAETKKGEIYITLAIALARLERDDEALQAARKAVALAKTPKEEWYRLLAALYFRTGDEGGMVATLKQMVTFFGAKKSYLDQLFSVYMKQEAYADALAVRELAYKKGFIATETGYRSLAMLYAYGQNPLAAATVMHDGIENGTVEKNEANLKTLYEYLITAKEHAAAINYLEQAAALSKDGALQLQLGQLLFESESYAKAAGAIETALKRGGLKHPEEARLLLGAAYYEAGERAKALDAFIMLETSPSKRETARSWIRFLQNLD